jgi:hypothetical protein
MNDRQDRKAFYRELGRYSALGFEMALSVVIGLGIGYYLDKWLGTAPWLMILWLVSASPPACAASTAPPSGPRRSWRSGRRTKRGWNSRWALRSVRWSGGSFSPPR